MRVHVASVAQFSHEGLATQLAVEAPPATMFRSAVLL